jgi:hypothetical protein
MVRAYAAEQLRAGREPDRRQAGDKDRGLVVKSTSALLTWQGPWGVIDDATGPACQGDLQRLVAALKDHPATKCLWAGVLGRMEVWVARHHLDLWAAGLEVCTRSWRKDGTVRVHVHAFVQRGSQLRRQDLSQCRLGGVQPHRSADGMHTRARGRALQTAYNAGMYYVQAPKIGQVFSAGCREPHTDYVVQVELITGLWQTNKMSDESAFAEYVRQKRDVERHVSNLRRQVQLRQELELLQSQQEAAAALQATVRPSRVLPAVNDWLEEQRKPAFRQRFLVLDGPSRTGKTRYAVGLKGPGATLELNCAGVTCEPDLRAFRPGQHRCLVFDEAAASMVVRNKKLFQAPVDGVCMGQSSTNCYAYTVSCHQVLMVVCSNKWSAELEELSREDREWLQQNQVYVHVSEPLWLP